MKLLLNDSLNQQLQLKDLLSAISQAEAPGLSVLEFSRENHSLGEIYFLGGHYIVYAKIHTKPATSQGALDELLQLTKGDFVYYASDSMEALPQQEDELKIDLKGLLENWQETKVSVEGVLLDKIFNVPAPPANIQSSNRNLEQVQALEGDSSPVIEAQYTETLESKSAVEAKLPAKNLAEILLPREDLDWDLVDPLVSSGAPGSGTDKAKWTPDKNVSVSQDLRSVSSGSEWRRSFRRFFLFIFVVVICFVVACCIWVLFNSPSARLQPKRYVLPTERHYLHRAP